jgi:hypothetical protein
MKTRTLCIALVVLGACRKEALPSPEFSRAEARFNEVYGRKLDGAYQDTAAMDEVLALLAKVPADSSDAAAAAELRQRIEAGRAARAAEEQRLEAIAAGAAATPVFSAEGGGAGGGAAQADAGTEDGGSAAQEGAAAADFEAEHKGCVTQGLPFAVQGSDIKGNAWELNATDECKAKFPALVGKRVYVSAGKVYRVEEAERGKVVEAFGDPKNPRLPDAGAPATPGSGDAGEDAGP